MTKRIGSRPRVLGLDSIRFARAAWVMLGHFGQLPYADRLGAHTLPQLVLRGISNNLASGPRGDPRPFGDLPVPYSLSVPRWSTVSLLSEGQRAKRDVACNVPTRHWQYRGVLSAQPGVRRLVPPHQSGLDSWAPLGTPGYGGAVAGDYTPRSIGALE
jgi:hypothetical protein